MCVILFGTINSYSYKILLWPKKKCHFGITLTLQETRSIHDSMNRLKIEFIGYIYILL